MGLLEREEPIVASLYLQRTDPFLPIAYVSKDEKGYKPLDLSGYGRDELVPVVGAGTGGMLIRSEVFHQLDPPWFVHTTEQSEDLYFCDRAVAAGIPLFVDLRARLSHMSPVKVFPAWMEDEETGKQQYAAGIEISPSARVYLPIVIPTEEPEE